MPKERNLLKMIFTNFVKSFRPRQIKGNLKGEDHLGTKYFEIPKSEQTGKSKRSRWFEPTNQDFEQEIPAEWEAWLRGRRLEPPSPEEILKNMAIAQMKKTNAAEISLKEGKGKDESSTKPDQPAFPVYGSDFETFPGEVIKKKK